jgi:hypothetical protein
MRSKSMRRKNMKNLPREFTSSDREGPISPVCGGTSQRRDLGESLQDNDKWRSAAHNCGTRDRIRSSAAKSARVAICDAPDRQQRIEVHAV